MARRPPWGSPEWRDLNFNNACPHYADYAAWILTDQNEPPFPTVAAFWRTALPWDNATSVSNSQIVDWNEWVRTNHTGLSKEVLELGVCRTELCTSLVSEMDSDLAGVGVIASYGIEAALVTLYCIAALVSHFRKRRIKKVAATDQAPSFIDRLLKTFQATLYDLFTAATFLGFGIQVAVIYTITSPLSSRRYQETSVKLLSSSFSFFPLATLLPMLLNVGRRQWVKGGVLAGLFCITTAAWVLCVDYVQVEQQKIEHLRTLCPMNYPGADILIVTMYSTAAMIWMPPLFGLCLSVVLCFYRCNRKNMWQARWLNRIVRWAMIFYSTASFILMWGNWIFLVAFFRGTSQRSNPAVDEWSFGQILALVSWGPLLVEFGYMLCFDVEVGFNGRLLKAYHVVKEEKALHISEGDGLLEDST